MKTIKKVTVKDLGKDIINAVEPKSWNPDINMAKLINIPYAEEMPLELENPIQYSEIEEISKIQSPEERVQALTEYIENQKKLGISAGKLIATIAKIAALPEKITVDPKEAKVPGPWAAAGVRKKNPFTQEYLAVHDLAANILMDNGKINERDDLAYGSCAQAACAVIVPTYDSELPKDSPIAQYEYLTDKNNDKWTEVNVNENGKTTIKEGTSWSSYDLRPGDLVLTEQAPDETQHVLIYIGEEGGVPTFYEAEAHKDDYSVYPYITRQPIVDDHKDGVSRSKDRQYHVFRPNV